MDIAYIAAIMMFALLSAVLAIGCDKLRNRS
jgi:hypothetical protein